MVSSAPASGFWKESVSHGDSAISHPRDQDYLSLWVGKSSEVELQQVLAYMVANLHKWEREEKAKHDRELEVILDYLRPSITPTPCSLPGVRREETVTATHVVDAF